jgi:hypothetical protein
MKKKKKKLWVLTSTGFLITQIHFTRRKAAIRWLLRHYPWLDDDIGVITFVKDGGSELFINLSEEDWILLRGFEI